MNTAMSRAKPDLIATFDKEINDWAERVRIARPLKQNWDTWLAETLRYRRRLKRKRQSAAHHYVLAYLRMIINKISEQKLKPDPRQRALLIRVMARLEHRILQLDEGL